MTSNEEVDREEKIRQQKIDNSVILQWVQATFYVVWIIVGILVVFTQQLPNTQNPLVALTTIVLITLYGLSIYLREKNRKRN